METSLLFSKWTLPALPSSVWFGRGIFELLKRRLSSMRARFSVFYETVAKTITLLNVRTYYIRKCQVDSNKYRFDSAKNCTKKYIVLCPPFTSFLQFRIPARIVSKNILSIAISKWNLTLNDVSWQLWRQQTFPSFAYSQNWVFYLTKCVYLLYRKSKKIEPTECG